MKCYLLDGKRSGISTFHNEWHLIQRVLDGGVSAALASIFLASSFLCYQAETQAAQMLECFANSQNHSRNGKQKLMNERRMSLWLL
jgi:hypothetical protein